MKTKPKFVLRIESIGWLTKTYRILVILAFCVSCPYIGLVDQRFFETPEIGIIGIFILPKYGNKLELITSDISFNSVLP